MVVFLEPFYGTHIKKGQKNRDPAFSLVYNHICLLCLMTKICL